MTSLHNTTRIAMAAADLEDADFGEVLAALRSGRLTMGSRTDAFESLVAQYCGARHAVAVNSGTAGLHLLCCAAGIGPNDEVITTSFSFVASTNCFLYLGAAPVFVDIEPDTYCIDPHLVEQAITSRTKAILAVDVFGTPAEWNELSAIADRHGLALIADACEALGAEYHGKKCGPFGIGGVFAFFPNKQMTTGEGGIIVTNDSAVARTCRQLRNQGRDEESPWLQHAVLGYNYRMTEMSAALGIAQLRRLDVLLEKRRRVSEMYDTLLAEEPRVRTLRRRPGCRTSHFVYIVELLGQVHRDAVIRKLAERGIPSRGYFAPIHQQPYIKAREFKVAPLPVTERVASRTVALPFHNNLSLEDAQVVVQALRDVLDESD
jgi:perosamine synthetase